jgi:hypothetical protein
MFKHPYCGRQHETVAQARHCEAANTSEVAAGAQAIRDSQTPDETWPWAGKTETAARPAKLAYPAKKPISDKKFKPLGVAYAEALAVQNGSPFEPSFVAPPAAPEPQLPDFGYEATEKQIDFIQKLLAERDWETGLDNDPIAQRVANGLPILRSDASSLITALKALPKRESAEPKAHGEQPWRRLSRDVPAGYYAVRDENGKNHFYRVSVGRNDFYKVQEQASDELHFVSLNRYAGILQSILDFGLDNAGKFYATERNACRKCNRTLTDNTGNPYFAMGYGPDCGGK